MTRRVPRLGICRKEKAGAAGPQAWDGLVALNTHLLPLYQVAASAVPGGDTNTVPVTFPGYREEESQMVPYSQGWQGQPRAQTCAATDSAAVIDVP